ncbi:Pisatin demethylase [Rhypophila decipiens]|uniref:Pisatin demethylase n=1 Tax=Rhypophila decipiens TaxID=261697 RepID=A0AAN7B8K7_9PEZI|nr:Pisatin demethylase [Rhypophila decipiens]
MYPTIVDTILSHPFLSGGLALLVYYAVSTLQAWSRLRHIPGPPLASISYLWMILTARSARMSTIFADLSRQYASPVVRIGPNDVLTDDVELLRRMGAVRGTYDKSDWYKSLRWQAYVDSTFTTSNHAVHDTRKARIAVAYNISGREQVDLVEPTVDEQVTAMIRLLRGKYLPEPGRLFDFSRVSSYFTMDVVTRAAFGKEFGNLTQDKDVTGFITGLRDAWPVISMVAEWPFMRRMLFSKTYLWFFGPKPTDQNGQGKLMGAVVDVVADRFGNDKKVDDVSTKKDMLASWKEHGLNRQDCEAEGLLAIVAGSETSASAMRIIMLSLLSSPVTYCKLKQVVKQAVREGKASSPVITKEECSAIPHLRAVIYEGLRMRPPAPCQFPKVVPSQGETVQGKFFLPGGTNVGMNLPALLRQEAVFGPDADLFRPERFMEAADEAQRIEMERTVELVFGSGRWMCAGKPIAFMELYKAFFELFRNFDFQLASPLTPLYSKSYLVFVEEDMWLKVTEAAME